MKNIKLIITDLDNTLLRRDKSISDYTISVFNRCRERGILIAFATSRSELASARFTAKIMPDIFISNGGALAHYNGKTLYSVSMSSDFVNTLIREMKKSVEIFHYTVEAENGYFNSEPIDKNWLGWVDYTHSKHTDFVRDIDFGDVYKITVKSTSDLAIQNIISQYSDLYMLNFRDEDWYQIKQSKSSKELALDAVAKKLKISLADIAAFGDDNNDTEMLSLVGYGVAVANAIPEVKAAAKFECGDCDNDGVARWVEKNVL